MTTLVRDHIVGVPDFQVKDDEGGIVAVLPSGEIIGVVVVAGVKFESTSVMFLRVVVAPAWRGRGLGTVLLNMLALVLNADMTIGSCAPSEAGFYANAGFTVLRPNVPLPFPAGRNPHAIAINNDVYPYAIYRIGA
ncbi:GNAT family N-acetyltransferase [Rhodococcus sp. ACT016]|uniref:GNAT family N-acetyltransferase n=1 Tax=Rhodococcus sp. ACT016 TaxID=3134808 RepID=UPI003D2A2E48